MAFFQIVCSETWFIYLFICLFVCLFLAEMEIQGFDMQLHVNPIPIEIELRVISRILSIRNKGRKNSYSMV